MNRPIIAFDCDDVIVATGSLLVGHYNKLHGTIVQPSDFYSKDYEHVWKAEPETAIRDLFAFLLTDEYANLPPMVGAVEVLRELADNYTLYVVTGRPDATEEATTQWIEKYLPGIFERVVFTNFFKLNDSKGVLRTKADACIELGAEYLVDDHVHHIQNVAERGLTGLLFGDLPWEQPNHLPQGAVKVKDWHELLVYFANKQLPDPHKRTLKSSVDRK
jgi:5'(3')-deoxyribonucleotidase